jgi:hypothetical protein
MRSTKLDGTIKVPNTYLSDCKLIKSILFEAGYDISLNDIYEIWDAVSERSCAGWLMVGTYSPEEIISMCEGK